MSLHTLPQTVQLNSTVPRVLLLQSLVTMVLSAPPPTCSSLRVNALLDTPVKSLYGAQLRLA